MKDIEGTRGSQHKCVGCDIGKHWSERQPCVYIRNEEWGMGW